MSAAKSSLSVRSIFGVAFRWLGRLLFGVVAFYASFLALGCIPVNGSYVPATGEDRVVIYVRSNEIHTDLVLPVVHAASDCDWRALFPPDDFRSDVRGCEHVAIGWGNRAFYIDTPTWADFKIRTAARALFLPSESVLHVEFVPATYPVDDFREVSLSPEQYQRLIAFVRESLTAGSDGSAVSAGERSYHGFDRFYESTGSYHACNTCNQWTGRGLKRAGVKTGLWTPLKPQVLAWLPKP